MNTTHQWYYYKDCPNCDKGTHSATLKVYPQTGVAECIVRGCGFRTNINLSAKLESI